MTKSVHNYQRAEHKTRGIVQSVKFLPSKHEDQNSDTSLAWRPTLVIPVLERYR